MTPCGAGRVRALPLCPVPCKVWMHHQRRTPAEPLGEVYHLGGGGLAAEDSYKDIGNDKMGEGERGGCQATPGQGRCPEGSVGKGAEGRGKACQPTRCGGARGGWRAQGGRGAGEPAGEAPGPEQSPERAASRVMRGGGALPSGLSRSPPVPRAPLSSPSHPPWIRKDQKGPGGWESRAGGESSREAPSRVCLWRCLVHRAVCPRCPSAQWLRTACSGTYDDPWQSKPGIKWSLQ